MSPRITLATAGRILRQLRNDRRTVALLVVVPSLLLTLLYFMYNNAGPTFDRIALIMLGVFPFVIMFLVTSIAMLRERTTGTLERLLTTPLAKLDLLFGYGIAFGLVAALQAAVAAAVSSGVQGLEAAAVVSAADVVEEAGLAAVHDLTSAAPVILAGPDGAVRTTA